MAAYLVVNPTSLEGGASPWFAFLKSKHSDPTQAAESGAATVLAPLYLHHASANIAPTQCHSSNKVVHAGCYMRQSHHAEDTLNGQGAFETTMITQSQYLNLLFTEQNSHQLGFVAHHIHLCFQARMSDESHLAPHPRL